MAKILVTGGKGQLGHQIKLLLAKSNELVLTDSDDMDITDKSMVEQVLEEVKPEIIIHGAAYTKVDLAEDESDICRKINAEGTRNIAEVANKYGATLIYISTDYVFDGNSGFRAQDLELSNQDNKISATEDPGPRPYRETDTPNPLSVYGRTKLEGERFIQRLCNKHYIIRVSWLFGELPEGRGGNFVETMLRLGKEKEELSIVNDQIGSPTYTKDLVEIIGKIIRAQDLGPSALNATSYGSEKLNPKSKILGPIPYGIYHFSGNNPCSWYEFAREIFKLSNTKVILKPITSDQYPQKAKRPAYSYLNKNKINKALGMQVRDWQEMVNEYLTNKGI